MFFKALFSSNTYILDSNTAIEIGANILYKTANSSEDIIFKGKSTTKMREQYPC